MDILYYSGENRNAGEAIREDRADSFEGELVEYLHDGFFSLNYCLVLSKQSWDSYLLN